LRFHGYKGDHAEVKSLKLQFKRGETSRGRLLGGVVDIYVSRNFFVDGNPDGIYAVTNVRRGRVYYERSPVSRADDPESFSREDVVSWILNEGA